MLIKYESVTGEVTEVEVSEEIGAVIIDSRRKEENLARKERYHCYSLDAIKYGDTDKFAPSTGETPLTELIRDEDNSYIYEAFAKLSERLCSSQSVRRLRVAATASSMLSQTGKRGLDQRGISRGAPNQRFSLGLSVVAYILTQNLPSRSLSP